jgi:hypothetical protein
VSFSAAVPDFLLFFSEAKFGALMAYAGDDASQEMILCHARMQGKRFNPVRI